MRLLQVVTLIDPDQSYGGPVSVALTQCEALLDLDHEVSIAAGWLGAASGAPPSQLEGVPCHLRPVRRVLPGNRFSALLSRAVLSMLWQNVRRSDVVHIHLARDLVPISAALMCIATATPYVVQTHGMVMPDSRLIARFLDATLIRIILRRAKERFSLTDKEEHGLRRLSGPDAPIARLRNAVKTAPLAADNQRQRATNEVLFLARLHPRKRVVDFIEAARLMLESGGYKDIYFKIIGPDEGDAHLAVAASADARFGANIQYEGPLPHEQVIGRLSNATIYVLPSLDEPFPMSLLEALAAGTPSICTTQCGIANELAGASAAVVVPPQSPQELAEAISALIRDANSRRNLQLAGQRYAQDHFSPLSLAKSLDAAYQRARSQNEV